MGVAGIIPSGVTAASRGDGNALQSRPRAPHPAALLLPSPFSAAFRAEGDQSRTRITLALSTSLPLLNLDRVRHRLHRLLRCGKELLILRVVLAEDRLVLRERLGHVGAA